MLQQLHERLRGFVAWLVVGLISVTFVLFGIEYFLQSKQVSSGGVEVNGQSLSNTTIELTYRRMQQGLPLEAAHQEAALKKQAVESLITTTLLTQAAQAAGLVVPLAQVKNMIMQIPAFQEKGHFSWKRYQQLLANVWYTPLTFQQAMTQDMLINQQRFGVVGTAFALPSEGERALKQQFERRDISYVVLPLSRFLAQSQPSEAQIRAYYDAHASEFVTPQEVRVAYVELSLDALKATLAPSEVVLQAYYEDNKASLPKTMQSFEAAKAALRTQWIADQAEGQYAKAAETLSEMSYQYADTLTEAAKALLLPIQYTTFFSREKGSDPLSQAEPIRAAAFSTSVLAQGNNSEPIAIDKTHLVVLRVAAQHPSTSQPYAQVHDQIIPLLQKQLAASAIQAAANQLLSVHPPAALQALTWTDQTGVTRQMTTLDPAIRETVFQLSLDHPTRAVALPNGDYACVRLQRVLPGDLKAVSAEQRQAVMEQLAIKFGERDEALYVDELRKKASIRKV